MLRLHCVNATYFILEILVVLILLSPVVSFRSLKNGRYVRRLLTMEPNRQQQQQNHDNNNRCLSRNGQKKTAEFVTFFTQLCLSNRYSDDSYENRRLLSSRYYKNYAKDIENTSRIESNENDDLMQQQVMRFIFKDRFNNDNLFSHYDLESDILDSYVVNPYQSAPVYDNFDEDYSLFAEEDDEEDEYCGIDDGDCDIECVIPEEFKEYTKNHNNIDVLSYLGIRRANPLQPPEHPNT